MINYRSAIIQAVAGGFTGAFLCEHDGSNAITVIGRNRASIREILDSITDRPSSNPTQVQTSTWQRSTY